MGNDLISIIVPTFNSSKYLSAAVKSVLGQTYKNIEIIIIDDGSSDNTREVIESFADKRIRYFYQENKGQSNARNRGIAHAQGSFIAFLDCDDIWEKSKLEEQFPLFSRKTVSLVYSDLEIVDSELRFKGKGKKHLFRGDVWSKLVYNNFISCSSVVVRKQSLLNEKDLFKQDRLCEDWDLWLRLSERHAFDYVDKALIKYRLHDFSLSKNIDEMANGRLLCLEDCNSRLDRYSDQTKYRSKKQQVKRAISFQYLIYGHQLLNLGDNSGAKINFHKAFKITPCSLRVYWALLKIACK